MKRDFATPLCLMLLLTCHVNAFRKKPATPIRPQLVLDALAQNRPLYYFGLGSNMLREKLENRGLNGTKIDIISMQAGVAPNYRLAFNLRGFPPLEPGMGSLEPAGSSSKALLRYGSDECHGALVKLTPANYEKVMLSEGVSGKPDQGYEEIVVDVFPYGRRRKAVKAVALYARDHVRLNADPCPSRRYMKILRQGAKELGLRDCYQTFLAEHPIQVTPKWQRWVAIHNLVLIFTLSFKLKWRGFSRFQSWLLFSVYVPSNDIGPRKILSNILTTAILLPGATVGFVLCAGSRMIGKEPAMLKSMMSRLSDEEGEKEEAVSS